VTDRPEATGVGGGFPPPARLRPFLNADVGDDTPPGGIAELQAVRPFVMTSGRVQGSAPAIGLETQVRARLWPTGGLPRLTPEQAAIVALSAEPVSVAEISAWLHLHLGVAKILVGDLHLAGYLDVLLRDLTSPHDPDTILRVMRGLRAIA
jgi:hypothetical protein